MDGAGHTRRMHKTRQVHAEVYSLRYTVEIQVVVYRSQERHWRANENVESRFSFLTHRSRTQTISERTVRQPA